METYCADKFDKFDKIDNNNLKIDNYRLLTTYPFIDFYRFPIQLTNFYRFYQLLSIIELVGKIVFINNTLNNSFRCWGISSVCPWWCLLFLNTVCLLKTKILHEYIWRFRSGNTLITITCKGKFLRFFS